MRPAAQHLDNGEELGHFLEFEVPVKEGDDGTAAERLAMLMRKFGLSWDGCIRASYVDLILDQRLAVEH